MKHISTYILEIVLFQIVFPFVDDYICTRLHSMGTAGYLAAHVSFGILFHYHAILGHLFLNQDDLNKYTLSHVKIRDLECVNLPFRFLAR